MMRIILNLRTYSKGLTAIVYLICSMATAQQKAPVPSTNNIDTLKTENAEYFKHQKDLIDIVYSILQKNPDSRIDISGNENTDLYFSVAPILEYTTATGFAPGIACSAAFKTSVLTKTNTSSILAAVKYTQKRQFILPIQSSLWSPGNKFNIVGDMRFLYYPQDSYGFGGYTTLNDKYIISYKYVRVYEYVLKRLAKNIYLGPGYQLDHHWDITEEDVQPGRVTDFRKYGFSSISTSSGLAIDLLYDSRESSINPSGGTFYANLQFLQNATFLGANSNWNSLLIDLRKYFSLGSHNILAFWFFAVFTLSGDPPYLDLPATGSDTYNNVGRGYETARFTGKKMVDLEGEFRFRITKNGLIGGVVFVNAESLSELSNNRLEVISPAVGLGIRVSFNKFSKTNTCIDYGIGTKDSRGFAGNLGEVF